MSPGSPAGGEGSAAPQRRGRRLTRAMRAGRFSVCVFCASSEHVGGDERSVAARLGAAIAQRGWRLVYGGGGVGLMGEVARGALGAGGEVLGVIPHRLATREIALDAVTELLRTETMRERKHHMDEASDAFVVLPGGIGTLEELVEILTLKQLGYHDRPIVLLDPLGYWKPLRAQLDLMVEHGLSTPSMLTLFDVAHDPEEALDLIAGPHPARLPPSAEEALELFEDEDAFDDESTGGVA
jgi:cytokinin riboside 5'-monophosphate phosphoribohydrolase